MSSINRKIAEARGWTNLHTEVMRNYCVQEWQDTLVGRQPGGQYDDDRVPDYENDLNAAWPLLAEMLGEPGIIKFISHLSSDPKMAAREISIEWLQWKGIEYASS